MLDNIFGLYDNRKNRFLDKAIIVLICISEWAIAIVGLEYGFRLIAIFMIILAVPFLYSTKKILFHKKRYLTISLMLALVISIQILLVVSSA